MAWLFPHYGASKRGPETPLLEAQLQDAIDRNAQVMDSARRADEMQQLRIEDSLVVLDHVIKKIERSNDVLVAEDALRVNREAERARR